MDDSFRSILINVFMFRCFVLLLLVAIVAFIDIIFLNKKKKEILTNRSVRKKRRIQDYEEIKRNCIAEFIIGLLGITALFFMWAFLPVYDLNNSTIATSEAIYCREDMDGHANKLKPGGDINITINNETFTVELYPGFSEKDFPQGTYHARVWYGEKSKLLLQISLIDVAD